MPTITEFYGQDHDRLDRLFKAFQNLKATDKTKVCECFREFAAGLKRHIAWEEEILFPVFDEKTGMQGMGPTEVMRIEHRQIRQLLAAIDRLVQEETSSDAEEAALLQVLEAHNQKEEHILYPAMDRQMTDPELRQIFARMEEVTHG